MPAKRVVPLAIVSPVRDEAKYSSSDRPGRR